jgi:hypothetical protein
MQDMIRYVFTFPETWSRQPISPEAVDLRLYALYALCFGLVNALLYIWVRSLTRNGWWALGVTVVWAVHPGYLSVMTLLDPSALAMVFVSLSLLFLYLFLRYRYLIYSTGFFGALLLASLTRSITQTHVLAVVLVALVAFWFIASKRAWWQMSISVLLVALLFVMPLRMQILYATWDVSSYGGYHRSGALWIDPRTVPQPVPESVMEQYRAYELARANAEDPAQLVQMTPDEIRRAQFDFVQAEALWQQQRVVYPDVDFSTARAYPDRIEQNALKFSSRFNTREQVLDNFRLGAAANEFLFSEPVESAQRLAQSLAITVPEAFRPASEYTQNYLVEDLPWRGVWDWLFSGWRYVLLIAGAAAVIMWTRGWQGTRRLLVKYGWFAVYYALLALPIMFSNRYRPGDEDIGPMWTDAIRQKVFLEIPVWALGGYALWLLPSRQGRLSWPRRKLNAVKADREGLSA